MSSQNIVRAWKDAAFRNGLTEAERAALPPNPAGVVELSDADLGKVSGGFLFSRWVCTPICTRVCTQGSYCCTYGHLTC